MEGDRKLTMRKSEIIQIIIYVVTIVSLWFGLANRVNANSDWIESEGKPFIKNMMRTIREEVDRQIVPVQKQLDRIEAKLDKLQERR